HPGSQQRQPDRGRVGDHVRGVREQRERSGEQADDDLADHEGADQRQCRREPAPIAAVVPAVHRTPSCGQALARSKVSAVRPSPPILRAALCAVVGVGLLLSGSAHAYADPSIGEIEQQIDDEWNKLEPAIEQYNNVHGQLTLQRRQMDALQRRLAPLQLQVDVAMARVGELAAQYYRSGQGLMVNAVLSGGSPDEFVYKLMIVNQMAHMQRGRIDVVASARDKYAADKKQVDGLIAQLAKQDADLAA